MKRFAPIVIAACALAGCELQLLPDAGADGGRQTAAVRIAVDAVGVGEAPMEGGVEIDILDVRLHRAADDTWVIAAGESRRVRLPDEAASVFPAVPISTGLYDEVAVVVGEVRVQTADGWEPCEVAGHEVLAPLSLPLVDDVVLAVALDLDPAQSGGHLVVEPVADVTLHTP